MINIGLCSYLIFSNNHYSSQAFANRHTNIAAVADPSHPSPCVAVGKSIPRCAVDSRAVFVFDKGGCDW